MKIVVPDDVLCHLKPDTVFILNKSDLTRGVDAHDLQEALNDALSRHASGTKVHFWSISLHSSEGTQEFLDGLASVLKERYA